MRNQLYTLQIFYWERTGLFGRGEYRFRKFTKNNDLAKKWARECIEKYGSCKIYFSFNGGSDFVEIKHDRFLNENIIQTLDNKSTWELGNSKYKTTIFFEFNNCEEKALIVAENINRASFGYSREVCEISECEKDIKIRMIPEREANEIYKNANIKGCKTPFEKALDFGKRLKQYKETDSTYMVLLIKEVK